jgi:hypothetical protein
MPETNCPGVACCAHCEFYFGTDPDPPLVAPWPVWDWPFHPGLLDPNATYYWRVFARNSILGTGVMSPVWTSSPTIRIPELPFHATLLSLAE